MSTYRITRSTTENQTVWAARENGTDLTLGTLTLCSETHEIAWIGTHPRYRRQGIATALRRQALADGFEPQHSPYRTPEGDAWAHSTGDPLPACATFARHGAKILA